MNLRCLPSSRRKCCAFRGCCFHKAAGSHKGARWYYFGSRLELCVARGSSWFCTTSKIAGSSSPSCWSMSLRILLQSISESFCASALHLTPTISTPLSWNPSYQSGQPTRSTLLKLCCLYPQRWKVLRCQILCLPTGCEATISLLILSSSLRAV